VTTRFQEVVVAYMNGPANYDSVAEWARGLENHVNQAGLKVVEAVDEP